MRAGALDRTITLQRWLVVGDDGYGNEILQWEVVATLRAQLVQSSTAEFIRTWGTDADSTVIFRVRFLAGVTTADRVVFEDAAFNIVELKEIGRREGLELRCTRIRQ